MSKKRPVQISDYYKKKDVVATYDARRFHGEGGNYIHRTELETLCAAVPPRQTHLKVLDVGAGRGRATKELIARGYSVSCLEYSEEMVKTLIKDVKPKKVIHQSAFDELPSSEVYDCITSLRFFDHFDFRNQFAILTQLKKSLAPQGVIALTILNSRSLEGVLARFFPYGRYNYYYSNHTYTYMFQKLTLKPTYKSAAFFIPRGAFLVAQKVPGLTSLLTFFDSVCSKLFPSLCALRVIALEK